MSELQGLEGCGAEVQSARGNGAGAQPHLALETQDKQPSELYTYVSFCKKAFERRFSLLFCSQMHTERDQQKLSIRSFRLVEDEEVRAEMMKAKRLNEKRSAKGLGAGDEEAAAAGRGSNRTRCRSYTKNDTY